MMILHHRQTGDQLYTPSQLAASASVRKQWVIFEQWFSGQREVIEKQRSKALKDIDKKLITKKEKDSRRTKLIEDYAARLGEIARLEWDRRLEQAGHTSDEWLDLTVTEAMKIERTFGGPLAHLSEKEYAAQWAAQQTPPSSTQLSFSVPPPQQIFSPPPISAAPSTQSQSSTYEFFSPPGYGDADDEREAGSSSLEALTALTLGNEYITSDEDPDVDTQAYFAWSSNAAQKSSNSIVGRSYTPKVDAKPPIDQPGLKKVQHPATLPANSHTNPAKPISAPKASVSSFSSLNSEAVRRLEGSATPAPQRVTRQRGAGPNEGPSSRREPLQEEQTRKQHQWLLDQEPCPPTQIHPIVDDNMALTRIPSNHSEQRSRAPGYIGPHQQTDPSDTLKEEAEFERFKMSVREEKIVEFHKEAAEADINLARDIHHTRNHWGLTQQEEAEKIAEHMDKMIQLRKSKEAERKKIVDDERARRRASFLQRSQEVSSSEMNTSRTKPTTVPPKHKTSNSAVTPAQPRQGLSAVKAGRRTMSRDEVSGHVPSGSEPPVASATPLPADLAIRFAESQRLAQSARAGPSPFDTDITRRFQESQKLAQSFASAQQPTDTASTCTKSSSDSLEGSMAKQPTDITVPARSGFRTIRKERKVTNGIDSEPAWGRSINSLVQPPCTASTKHVTVEEIEDDDANSWVRMDSPAEPPFALKHQEVSSSIQRLEMQVDSPLIYEIVDPLQAERSTQHGTPTSVVPIASFREDEEPVFPGSWDPSDMESPAYWDALLNLDDSMNLSPSRLRRTGPLSNELPVTSKSIPSPAIHTGMTAKWHDNYANAQWSHPSPPTADRSIAGAKLGQSSTMPGAPSLVEKNALTTQSLPQYFSKSSSTSISPTAPSAPTVASTSAPIGKPNKKGKGGKRR